MSKRDFLNELRKSSLEKEIQVLEETIRILSEDFITMCPEMKRVAVDPDALVARYRGYVYHGIRPELPSRSDNGGH